MDVVTYALCKKMIGTNSTSIKSITLDASNNLVFDMVDGTQFKTKLPIDGNYISNQLSPAEDADLNLF